jgi:AcrR family transcriptional regulator
MNGSTPRKAGTRERLIEAVVIETAESGHAALTVERITHRADVTRASFLAHFADSEAAIEAAYQHRFESYVARLLEACKAQASWSLKVKVGIGATLDLAAASPTVALFLVETMPWIRDFSGGIVDSRDRLARLLLPGRTATPHGADLPGILEAALVGGIAGVISAQLRAGEANRLPALAPQLVEVTLTPYLGRDEAAELAQRPRQRFEDR